MKNKFNYEAHSYAYVYLMTLINHLSIFVIFAHCHMYSVSPVINCLPVNLDSSESFGVSLPNILMALVNKSRLVVVKSSFLKRVANTSIS